MTAPTITDRRATIRRQADQVRVTPDLVVANVLDALDPLLKSEQPDLLAVYLDAARALRMLQR